MRFIYKIKKNIIEEQNNMKIVSPTLLKERAKVIQIFLIFLLLFSTNLEAETYSFDKIVKKTLSHNYKLKEMDENIYQSELLISKAYTFLQPIWNAGARFTVNNQETAITMPFFDQTTGQMGSKSMVINEKYAYGFNTTVNYTLLNLRAWPLVKVAKKMKSVRLLSKKMASLEIKFAIAQLYINSLILKKSNDINSIVKQNLENHLEFVKAKIELKNGIEIEKLRVETEIAKLETEISKTNGVLKQLKSQLASFMGIDNYNFDLEEISFEFPITKLNDMFKIATKERIENRLTKQQLNIEKLMLKNVYMKFFPTLYLQGAWNWNNSTGFTGEHSSWNINFMLNFSIYDGGIIYKELKEERSKIRAIRLKENSFNDKLKQSIKTILIDIDNKELSIKQIQNEIKLAKKSLELAKESYKLGVGKNIDVLDATLNMNVTLHKEMIEKLNRDFLFLKLKKELGKL